MRWMPATCPAIRFTRVLIPRLSTPLLRGRYPKEVYPISSYTPVEYQSTYRAVRGAWADALLAAKRCRAWTGPDLAQVPLQTRGPRLKSKVRLRFCGFSSVSRWACRREGHGFESVF